MSRLLRMPVALNGLAAALNPSSIAIGRKVRLVGALFSSQAGIVGHGTNFKTFRVLGSDGSTVVWEYSTDVGEEGTVTAKDLIGIAPDMTPDVALGFETAATGLLLEYEETEAVSILTVVGGTGVVSDAGLCLIFEPIS